MMNGIVYKATCLINGKIYVGQTVRILAQRIKEHTIGKKGLFARAIKKYGMLNFVFEVIDTADNRLDLNEKEILWINKLNSITPNGYNLTVGGEGCNGCVRSEETRLKMSNARRNISEEVRNKLRSAAIGRKHTQESKDKMRYAKTGTTASAETKARQSISQSGKIMSLEARRKVSVARSGKPLSPEHCLKIKVAKNNLSEETRLKMSESAKKKAPISEETRKKLSLAITGRTRSEETRKKMSVARITREVLKVWTAAA